jgi:hypothetical protein
MHLNKNSGKQGKNLVDLGDRISMVAAAAAAAAVLIVNG